MAASFPTSVKTFSPTPAAGKGIPYTAVSDAHEEIVALETFLLTSAAWTSYTPTWTSTGTAVALGNGVLSGRYRRIGKIVFVDISLVMGSTTTYGTGTYRWALPVTAADVVGQSLCARILDASAGYYSAVAKLASTSTTGVLYTGGTDYIGQTTPMTFTTSDEVIITGFYVAA